MVDLDIRDTAARIDARWSTESRLGIRATDPRCAWMFGESSETLGQVVGDLASLPDRENVEKLAHFTDYLNWLSEMDIYDELDSLLGSLDLDDAEIKLVLASKRLPTQGGTRDRHGVSHVLPGELEAKLERLKGCWAPASARLVEAACSICPTDTARFQKQLALVNDDPTSTILPVNIMNLQRLLGITNGIQVRMMKVMRAESDQEHLQEAERSEVTASPPSRLIQEVRAQEHDDRPVAAETLRPTSVLGHADNSAEASSTSMLRSLPTS